MIYRRALGFSRYVVLTAVVSTFVSSMALLLSGALMEITMVLLFGGAVSNKVGKALAVGLVEATDVYLIGIVLFICWCCAGRANETSRWASCRGR